MENALLVGLSRQVALRRELDVLANNLANVNTAGFKSSQLVFQEYLMPVASAETFPRGSDRKLSYVEDKSTWQDFSGGPIQNTGNDLDVAIDGDAYFAVETAQGIRYTRNGQFQLDTQGRLVTNEGYPVMGNGGQITFAPNETNFSIAADGTISTSEGIRGRLSLNVFPGNRGLFPEGRNTFRADVPPQIAGPEDARVLQRSIEKSNVEPVVETTRLIEISRAYQSLANMMQKQDDLRNTAVRQLAEIPA